MWERVDLSKFQKVSPQYSVVVFGSEAVASLAMRAKFFLADVGLISSFPLPPRFLRFHSNGAYVTRCSSLMHSIPSLPGVSSDLLVDQVAHPSPRPCPRPAVQARDRTSFLLSSQNAPAQRISSRSLFSFVLHLQKTATGIFLPSSSTTSRCPRRRSSP